MSIHTIFLIVFICYLIVSIIIGNIKYYDTEEIVDAIFGLAWPMLLIIMLFFLPATIIKKIHK